MRRVIWMVMASAMTIMMMAMLDNQDGGGGGTTAPVVVVKSDGDMPRIGAKIAYGMGL